MNFKHQNEQIEKRQTLSAQFALDWNTTIVIETIVIIYSNRSVYNMTTDRMRQLLSEGKGLTIEYKECVNELSNSVWETVCSFSNIQKYTPVESLS